MTRMTAMSPRQSGASRRMAARHKMFEPVRLHRDGEAWRAHLLDLSRTGARLHADLPPDVDQWVEVELFGLLLRGRVIWEKARRFGVRFDQALPDPLLQGLIDTVVNAASRPG